MTDHSDLVAELRAIDEAAMYEAPASAKRAIEEAAALIETQAATIEALETIIRDLAALPPGGEVWKRSKWLAELTERAKVMLATAIATANGGCDADF